MLYIPNDAESNAAEPRQITGQYLARNALPRLIRGGKPCWPQRSSARLPSGTVVVQPMVTNACIARLERKLRDR
jgi:hypothetical protein